MRAVRKIINFRNAVAFSLGVTATVAGAAYTVNKFKNKNFPKDFKGCGSAGSRWEQFAKFRGGFPFANTWDDNWDKFKCGAQIKTGSTTSKEEGQAESSAIRTIILVRHGQYNYDGKKDDTAHYLTPLGEEQAKILGQKLKKLKEQIGPFKIHVSPLQRTMQTAKIACEEAEIGDNLEIEPLLKEGLPCSPVPAPPSFKIDLTPEEQVADERQLEGAFRKYFHRADSGQKSNSVEVLVCHANVIRFFVCRSLQLPRNAWLRFQLNSLEHTSLTTIKIYPNGQVRLERYGDSGHLPDDKRTFMLES